MTRAEEDFWYGTIYGPKNFHAGHKILWPYKFVKKFEDPNSLQYGCIVKSYHRCEGGIPKITRELKRIGETLSKFG